MKKIWIVLAAVIVVIFVIGLAKDTIVKMSVEKASAMVTGLKLRIRTIHVGIFKTAVDIRGLRLENPKGFVDRTMAYIPEIYVHYDLPAIMAGKIHLPEARLVLREFVVVKNQKGELNLNALKTVQAQRERKPLSQISPGKAPEIMIDKLSLSIGKVIYKDYSRGATPFIQEFNINLNETYTNVNDPYKLASLIVVKALMNTSIARMANFDLQGLQGTIGDTLASAQKMVAQAGDVQATAKEAVGTATKAAKGAQATAKQAVSAVKDMFKNPFDSYK